MADVEDRLIEWLQTIPGFVHQLERHRTTDELATANQLHGRCLDYLSLLLSLYRRATELVPEDEDIQSDILEIIEFIGLYDAHYQEWVLHLIDSDTENSCDVGVFGSPISPACTLTGLPGRPPYDIPQSQLEALIELGFSYAAIARMLNVSPRTLRRRRAEFGLPAGRLYSDISDHHLDQLVGEILQVRMCVQAIILSVVIASLKFVPLLSQTTPAAGLQMVTGALRGRGIVVQRRRILESLRRLDPVSRSLQRLTTTYRRAYSVPGPNALW